MEAFDVRSLVGKSSQEVDAAIEQLRRAGKLPVGFPIESYSSQTRDGRVRMLALLQKGPSPDLAQSVDLPSESECEEVDSDSSEARATVAVTLKARWTKNDSARLIELVRSEEARELFVQASDVLSRAALDNRKNEENPWCGLAKIYNDYKHFKPEHVSPNDSRIGQLNPNQRRRPQWSPEQLSKRFSELKSAYSMAVQRHTRSGHHNGHEHEEREEFWHWVCNGDQVLFYAFCAWQNEADLEFVSRLAEGGFESGLDSCAASSSQAVKTPRTKRKSYGERLVQVIEEATTPPDEKRARKADTTDALRSMASALADDVAIKKEKLLISRRSQLIGDLTKALQSPNLSDAVRNALEQKLLTAFDTETSGPAVQIVNCTIGTQLNTL